MNKSILPFLAFSVGISSPAWALPSKATIFEPQSKRQKALFEFDHREETEAGKLKAYRNAYQDAKGTIAVKEEVLFQGDQVQRYKMENLQIGETGTLEVTADKLKFTYQTASKTKQDEEDRPDNLVIGPTIAHFLGKRWADVLAGKKIDARYAALDRVETVGFRYVKTDRKSAAFPDGVVVEMRPTSFIIASIVNPLYFTFSPDGSKLLEIEGRTAPKIQKDGKWRDLDAEMVFRY